MKVLILCTGNSCRSQIAEGFLRRLAGSAATICSAGIEAHGLNPRAVATMALVGIDISQHRSETTDVYLDAGVTHVITVCNHAAEVCPFFPEDVKFSHFSFPDPAKAKGSEEEIMAQFAEVRDEIATSLEQWWATNQPIASHN